MSFFNITIKSGGCISINAEIESHAEAVAFARAWDGAVTGAFPEEQAAADAEAAAAEGAEEDAAEEPAPAPGRPKINPVPGTRAHDVLELLRAGVVDAVAIADKLGMATNVAGRLKTQLVRGGHWSPEQQGGE